MVKRARLNLESLERRLNLSPYNMLFGTTEAGYGGSVSFEVKDLGWQCKRLEIRVGAFSDVISIVGNNNGDDAQFKVVYGHGAGADVRTWSCTRAISDFDYDARGSYKPIFLSMNVNFTGCDGGIFTIGSIHATSNPGDTVAWLMCYTPSHAIPPQIFQGVEIYDAELMVNCDVWNERPAPHTYWTKARVDTPTVGALCTYNWNAATLEATVNLDVAGVGLTGIGTCWGCLKDVPADTVVFAGPDKWAASIDSNGWYCLDYNP